MRFPLFTTALVAVALGTSFTYVSAQQDGQRQRAQRGERQQFDPEQMRERMMDALKERLGAADDEWEVLEPKVEAVTTAQQELRMGGMGMVMGRGMGPGGRGQGQGDDAEQSELQKAAQGLRTALEDESTAPEVLTERLTALRTARSTAQQNLAKAQGELKELLTARQEATLVMMGMME